VYFCFLKIYKDYKMQNIKAVIFDWAGTTVDYGCMSPAKVFIEAFKEKNIEITIDEAREPMGLQKRDHIEAVLKMPRVSQEWQKVYGKYWTVEDLDKLYEDFQPLILEVLKHTSDVINGIPELCQNLKNNNIKIGSCTGYMKEMMDIVIPIANSQGYFPDSIVTPSDVRAGRPAPWMIYKNCENLDVYPLHQIVKVGDTVADMMEGKFAGCWNIGITKTGNEVGYPLDVLESMDSNVVQAKIDAAETKLRNAGAHYICQSATEILPILNEISDRISNGERP